MTKLAVLGCGKMGEALVAGVLTTGWRAPEDVFVTGRREERLDELSERHGVEVTLDNSVAVAGAEVIVLSVKPQDTETMLSDVSAHVTPDQTVLSVIAAIPTSLIE